MLPICELRNVDVRRASFFGQTQRLTDSPATLMRTIASRSAVPMYGTIVALAVAASAMSLRNGFALDDVALVANNARVHSLDGVWRLFTLPYWPPQYGASLYRPLVMVGYAVQWAAAGGSPWVFHATSVVMYALMSALLLALFRLLLSAPAALIGAALFAVHPVHVEAVSTAFGQAELLTASAMLAAALAYVRRRRAGRVGPIATAFIATLFALACLAKEHGVLLPAILLALEWFAVTPSDAHAASLRGRLREIAPLFGVLAAVAIAFIVVRTSVLGGLLGERDLVPVQGFVRLGMMLVVAPHWLRLLVWPAQLSAEYSPQHIRIPDGLTAEVMAGVLVLAALVAIFFVLRTGTTETRAERAVARLGLVIATITIVPVTNLFSVLVIAERALLLPSVGAMLAVGAAVSVVLRPASDSRATRTRVFVAAATTVCVALGVVRSNLRHRVWHDDLTLFTQTVKDAPLSYRAQFFYGQILFAQGKRAEGERRLRLAIALNPTPSDVSPLNYLATQYRDAGMCPHALPLYEQALAQAEQRSDVRYGLASCLLTVGRTDAARRLAADGVRRGQLRGLFEDLLARSDSVPRRVAPPEARPAALKDVPARE